MSLGQAETSVATIVDYDAKRKEEGKNLAKAVAAVLNREMPFEEALHKISHYNADIGKELAKALSNGLNDYCNEATVKAFLEAMSREHRTLQQSFTKVVFAWLKMIADKDYPTDGRNEYAQKIARKALANLEDYETNLPLV